MEFKNLVEVLTPRGLKCPSLDVLHPDTGLYKAAILQPLGIITGNDEFVGNVNREETKEKHIAFFKEAKDSNCSIAITPEYSSPWTSIEWILANDLFPAQNDLWIIGAEAITPETIAQFKTTYENDFEIIYEDTGGKSGRFLDPLCYLFSTEKQNGERRKVILIQFKTKPMGDAPHHFERDRLILGEQVYILSNSNSNSIRLISFICSDVLGITNNEINEILTRSLIVHIQLNADPRNHTFTQYRKFCFDAIASDCEVLCVNWAENIQCPDYEPVNWGNISGTGIYLKSEKINLTDERVNSNHRLGLYLTYWDKCRTFAYFFNYSEHLFIFKNTKLWQFYGVNQQAGRTGPVCDVTKSWCISLQDWSLSLEPPDGFKISCDRITGDLTAIRCLSDTPVSIERLIALSHGLASDKSWFKIERIQFFQIDGSELINRISFAQDNHQKSKEHRERYLKLFGVFSHIVNSGANFPNVIADLIGDCHISYNGNDPIRNLTSNSEKAPATVVYLGENPSLNDVIQVYTNLQIILSEGKKDHYRLVIWFRDITGATKYYPEAVLPMNDADPNENLASITRS